MSNVITMVDESLGGILREYKAVPVDSPTEFRTTKLEATDVVVVDGERYRMVDRHAKVGEMVIVVNSSEKALKPGMVATCTVTDEFDDGSIDTDLTVVDDGFLDAGEDEYLVLEPLPAEECTGEPVTLSAHDIRWNPDKVIDMFAALAQKVTALEAKLDDLAGTNERALKRVADRVEENGKNIETLAQDLEAVKMIMLRNEDDIASVDDRLVYVEDAVKHFDSKCDYTQTQASRVDLTTDFIMEDIVLLAEKIRKLGGDGR